MNLSETLTVHCSVGDENLAAHHWLRLLILNPVGIDSRTDESLNGLGIALSASYKHLVAHLKFSVPLREAQLTVVQYTRADDIAVEELRNLLQCAPCDIRIGNFQIHHMRFLVRVGSLHLLDFLVLLVEIDMA